MPDDPLNTHGYRMARGKHKGELLTRVPPGYILWLANQPTHPEHSPLKGQRLMGACAATDALVPDLGELIPKQEDDNEDAEN